MKQMLFLDAAERVKNPKKKVEQKKLKNAVVSHYKVEEVDKSVLKKEKGDYFVLQFTDQILFQNPKALEVECFKILNSFLKKYHKDHTILVIGLGNQSIVADSFGSHVTNHMIATNHYNDFLTIPKIALFNPEVTEKTGISSFKLIRMVVSDLKPDMILVIDSLATQNRHYLNHTIEMNDTGIIPGSALRDNKIINKDTFGIPVIAIGVPFLLKQGESLLTSVDTHQYVNTLGGIMANVLNKALLS